MAIKLITIDFWNTLFDSSNGEERNKFRQRALIKEIDTYGIIIKGDEFNRAMTETWGFFNKVWKEESRTPPPKEIITFLWNYLDLPVDKTAIKNVITAFSESILDHPPKLMLGVKEVIPVLSKKYKLGIVSDTGFSPGKVLRKLLENERIIHYFDAFSFSDETGVSKPNPIAFETILEELNILAEESVHIGDIEATDIKGSKSMGMKAIRFSGDTTAFLNKENLDSTIADADAKSWNEIPFIIDNILNAELKLQY
jgi:putative hydrolase of the HAD superfamily